MSRRTILGWCAALLSALGTTLAVPADAHARRRCCNGGYGYNYNGYGNNGYSYNGRGYSYTAPVAANSPCAGTAAPTNPDGTMAPQPAPEGASPAAPVDTPPPPSPAK